MTNHIKHLKIRNFKSIKSLDLTCNRINIFIGKPNVGKSNILEALSLPTGFNGTRLDYLIRYNNYSNLFYDQDIEQEIVIETDLIAQAIYYKFHSNGYYLKSKPLKNFEFPKNSSDKFFEQRLSDGIGNSALRKANNLKRYIFKPFEQQHAIKNNGSLNAPFGENLITILQTNRVLRKEIAQYFKEYDLEILLDIYNQSIEIQKKIDDIVYQLPYNLIADTLQRIIFHLAAIQSNKNAILVFEEPENHSFPPYIRTLAQQIVESKTNQFFISTHSPYLVQTILQEAKLDEVSVIITDFKDYQTKVQKLEKEELREVLDYGIDLFFNLDLFSHE